MRYCLLYIFLFLAVHSFAQEEEGEKKFCKEPDSKDLVKNYEKGTDRKRPKPERLQFLKKCIDEDPDFAEANLALGFEIIVHCKLENTSFKPAVPYFMKSIANCPKIHSEPYYYIGFAYYEDSKNDSAVKYLQKFLDFKDDNEKKYGKDYSEELYQAKEMVKSVKKESNLKKKIVPFDPKVVPGVSTERDEYLAYISPDDKNCFFVRKVPKNSKSQVYSSDKEQEVFMRAIRDNAGNFDKGEVMPWPFNETSDNQGGCTISIDNKFLYFAMMRQEGGAQANCDLYVSRNVDDEWKPFEKLGAAVNHPVYWDSQPTLSADGNSIVFASDRPGGYGGTDLYITHKDPNTNEWGTPKNLGPKINTPGDERTPFIHTDSETLYFSSSDNQKTGGSGHYGFGGFDIFFARKNDKGEWNEPENIGYPINSEGDDVGFFVSTNAQTGYFFAFDEGRVRGKGIGRYDLYSFGLYKEARPKETTLVKGVAKDNEGNQLSGAQIENLSVEVQDVVTKKKTTALVDAKTGEYMVAVNIEKKNDVIVTLKDKNKSIAYTSVKVNMKDATFEKPPKAPDIIVDSIKVGKSFVINNIYYNTNSVHLFEESKSVLGNFADYLKEHPKMKIEIQGHTDNVGKAADNLALSTNRAFTVKALLESYGVEAGRVSAKGFGSQKPLGDNGTELGRAKNRRTEFEILENE